MNAVRPGNEWHRPAGVVKNKDARDSKGERQGTGTERIGTDSRTESNVSVGPTV